MLSKFRKLIFVLVILATASIPFVANAQDTTATDENLNELVGTIDEIGEDFIVVAGLTFDTTTAEVDDSVQLEVGAMVEVKFVVADQILVAVHIDNPSDDDNDDNILEDSKLYGTVEEMGDGFIVVAGQRFDTTTASTDAGVEVGVTVKVEFVSSEDGTLVAHSVETWDGDDDTCTAKQPDGWFAYTIKEGDTLSAIAIASRMDLDDLLEVNCITDASAIVVGATIYVENEPDFSIVIDDEDDGDDDNNDDHDDDDNSGDDSDDDHGDDNADDDNGSDDSGDDHGDDNDDDNGGDDSGDDHGDDNADDNGDDHGGDNDDSDDD